MSQPSSEFIAHIQTLRNNLPPGQFIDLDYCNFTNMPQSIMVNKVMTKAYVSGPYCGFDDDLVWWCSQNIHKDQLANEDCTATPHLFTSDETGEPCLERVMQVVQVLWNRVEQLEAENEQLRKTS